MEQQIRAERRRRFGCHWTSPPMDFSPHVSTHVSMLNDWWCYVAPGSEWLREWPLVLYRKMSGSKGNVVVMLL